MGRASTSSLVIAAVLLFGCSAESEVADVQAPRTLDAVVDTLRSGPARDRIAVEALLGPLQLVNETDTFRFHRSQDVPLDHGVTVRRVDLRERRGPPPEAHLLVLDVGGPCARREAVLARYPGLQVSQRPRGHSLDEETHFSRAEAWGSLSFGFAERAPDCLSSVVFNIDPGGAGTSPTPPPGRLQGPMVAHGCGVTIVFGSRRGGVNPHLPAAIREHLRTRSPPVRTRETRWPGAAEGEFALCVRTRTDAESRRLFEELRRFQIDGVLPGWTNVHLGDGPPRFVEDAEPGEHYWL